MKRLANPLVAFALAPILGLLTLALGQSGPPAQVRPEGIRGGSEVLPEQGVAIRHYVFQPTGEQLPYSVYVSSKVRTEDKAPLIIALRGFTGTTLTFVRGTAVDARYLAEKYPDTWAAVALLAPALFNVQVTAESKITRVPLLLAVGDKDSLITSARDFSAQLGRLRVAHEYVEMPGLDDGTIIMGSMPNVLRFFAAQAKPQRG